MAVRNFRKVVDKIIFSTVDNLNWFTPEAVINVYCKAHCSIYFLSFICRMTYKKIYVIFRDRDSCRSFSLLKAIANRLPLLFANAFKRKEQQLLQQNILHSWQSLLIDSRSSHQCLLQSTQFHSLSLLHLQDVLQKNIFHF